MDATEDSDLEEIGRAADDVQLLAGGSGVALGLPDNFRRAGRLSDRETRWTGAKGPCAILAGSSSQQTRAQVACHSERHPSVRLDVEAVVEGRTTAVEVADWTFDQNDLPLAYATADPETVQAAQARHGRERAAAAIEGLFADVARRLVERGVRRLIDAGGETSGAVVEASAWVRSRSDRRSRQALPP